MSSAMDVDHDASQGAAAAAETLATIAVHPVSSNLSVVALRISSGAAPVHWILFFAAVQECVPVGSD